MSTSNSSLSRRHFLRGAGVALGLPWLESLRAWGATEAATGSGAPRRAAVIFMGNGVNPNHWGATNGPDGMVFKDSLRPLEALKKQILVFDGLWNPTTVEGPGGHFPKMNLLAGLKVKQTTTDIEVGTTMDQVIAKELGHHTPVGSLVLGTEPPGYGNEDGFTSTYSGHISWSTPTSPSPKEIYPQQAFDQLFEDGSKQKRNKSLLDLVGADAQSLKKFLSKRDVLKMDEYLTSVRELEQRIERADAFSKKETNGAGWQPSVKEATFPRPAAGIPAHPEEHMNLMLDILVLAFQMDRTRVATLMLNNDLSGMNFGYLGGIKGGLHELSHHSNDPARMAMYQKANEYHMQLWARALTKMQATNEGERSLLDNSMIMFCSSLYDGNAHDSRKLPILLAGGGGGTIRGGRLLDYSQDPNRKLCRLHMAIMDRMGIHMNRFGDADTALSDLG
ncbi:MAG: DUF1552 domain-containing protein [Verrucomicrobiota bacterium]